MEPATYPKCLDPHFTPVLRASSGQCRDFALVPWTDFKIISIQISPKAKLFCVSGTEKNVTLKN